VGPRLEREAEHRDPLPLEVPHGPLDLADGRIQRLLVDLRDLAQQSEVVPESVRYTLERRDVLGKAVAAVPESRSEERAADPRVRAHDPSNAHAAGAVELRETV